MIDTLPCASKSPHPRLLPRQMRERWLVPRSAHHPVQNRWIVGVPLALMVLLSACASKQNHKIPAANAAPIVLQEDSAAIPQDILQADTSEFSPFYYCGSPYSDPRDLAAQELIGRLLPDLEDSTVLCLAYGSCARFGDHFAYNWGPQMWDEEDSVYMQVKERLGNDSLQIIYLRGELAITTTMHNHFNESALLVQRVGEGWRVRDAYMDAQTIDFDAVEIVDSFQGRLLRRYATAGSYGGGLDFASDQYTLLEPQRLRGSSISFIVSSSNTATDRCFKDESVPDYHCDCYEREGEVEFAVDPQWHCLAFQYKYEMVNGDCDMADAVTTHAQQTWLMNRDTALMIRGDSLSEWGEEIAGQVKLSRDEIKRLLYRRR